jgi:hypothetical protein
MKNILQAYRPSYLWFSPPLILGGSVISAGTIHDLRRVKVPGTGPLWNPWIRLYDYFIMGGFLSGGGLLSCSHFKLKPLSHTLYCTPFGTFCISMRKTSGVISFSFCSRSFHPWWEEFHGWCGNGWKYPKNLHRRHYLHDLSMICIFCIWSLHAIISIRQLV